MLKIVNYTKVYKNGKKAVDDLTMEIKAGEIYGFIGHNGAGKTTTLKAIAGVLDFSEGEIIVDGISLRGNEKTCKLKMAFIPDNPDVYEYLTGIQYLNFIADVYGVSLAERTTLIEKYAGEFDITDVLENIISSYSHGMRQKLVIISALIHKPKLLLLDEPFVGLDPKAALLLKGYMRDLCDDGSAIFFSTHVLDVAEKLCDKVAIIKDGKLVANGITAEVRGDSSLEDIFMEVVENEGN